MKKLLSVLFISLLILTGCSDSEKAEAVPKKTEYQIGETAEVDGLKITLNSTRKVEGDSLVTPESGTEWIALDFTFENTTEESIYIAGIFEITLKDADGRELTQNIWGDLKGSVDGDVLPGEKLTGEKSFEIKGDESGLFAYYKAPFSKSDAVKFIVK